MLTDSGTPKRHENGPNKDKDTVNNVCVYNTLMKIYHQNVIESYSRGIVN